MEKQDSVRREISRLLASQLLAVLATQQDGRPHASLMAFAVGNDLFDIYLATGKSTSKFTNILADGRVSLLVDDRTNQSMDFQKADALTIIGTAGELEGQERDDARKIYLARHPSLEEFVSSPTTALLKVAVSRYVLVTRFQEVFVLDRDDCSPAASGDGHS